MDEMTEDQYYEIEARIIDHQEKWIINHYGLSQAKIANYGWGVDERPEGPVVETKIYGPRKCLTTTYENGRFQDEVTDL